MLHELQENRFGDNEESQDHVAVEKQIVEQNL